MEIKPYTMNITPDVCSVDLTARWRLSAALRAMQEAGGGQCETIGLGYTDLYSRGLAWVLSRARVVMDEYPIYDRPLSVTTWPTAPRHGFFPRQFTFEADGRVLGRATSIYVLMDLNTRKIAPASRLPVEVPVASAPAVLPFPANIADVDAETRSVAYTPVYQDIDMNGHVNNTRYADWLCDMFPCERYRRAELHDVLIHYNMEARPGEELALELKTDGDICVMRGKRGEDTIFAIRAEWGERKL